jgi:hypothetical protein
MTLSKLVLVLGVVLGLWFLISFAVVMWLQPT